MQTLLWIEAKGENREEKKIIEENIKQIEDLRKQNDEINEKYEQTKAEYQFNFFLSL